MLPHRVVSRSVSGSRSRKPSTTWAELTDDLADSVVQPAA
jgi:hypothetical protein